MALFATGGVILTPELRTGADWSAWLQLGIAISMLSARTCAFGSLGILVLYGFGIEQYGVFHLSDYPMFIGLAAYLGLTAFTSERLRSQRMPILQASICITLMWGAVEKWAYPQWTFPLLAERPYLTFGLAPADFMVVAGFVEFAFAFYILTGFGLQRLAILGLGSIFAAAILDFGKVDAIGHLPILIAMAAMFLHGPTRLNLWLHDNAGSTVRQGADGRHCLRNDRVRLLCRVLWTAIRRVRTWRAQPQDRRVRVIGAHAVSAGTGVGGDVATARNRPPPRHHAELPNSKNACAGIFDWVCARRTSPPVVAQRLSTRLVGCGGQTRSRNRNRCHLEIRLAAGIKRK